MEALSTDDSKDAIISLKQAENMCDDIGSIYLNETYSDMVLIIGDKRFPVHKNILAARSEYFSSLFGGSFRESNQSEIKLEDNNVFCFEIILRYIYTGEVMLTNLREKDVVELVQLVNKYLFTELESPIINSILSVENVCTLLAASYSYSLTVLTEHCLEFADRHAAEILKTDGFMALASDVVEEIVGRDSFVVAEIDIFKGVIEWSRVNGKFDVEFISSIKVILGKIRLSLMTVDDLVGVVRDSEFVRLKLLPLETILDAATAVQKQMDQNGAELHYRGVLELGENVATADYGAKVVEGENGDLLLNGDILNYDDHNGYTHHSIGNDAIVVQLSTPRLIDTMRLLLWDKDDRAYRYYIETSVNQKSWREVVDKRNENCKSWQTLTFDRHPVVFIRITGTDNTANTSFHLVHFECKADGQAQQKTRDIIGGRSRKRLKPN